MITDEQIEQLLYGYTKRQDEFNLSVLEIIAGRLSKLADFDNIYSLGSASFTTKDVADITRAHQDFIKKQKNAIYDDFWWIALILYGEALAFYETQVELRANTELYQTVMAAINEAQLQLEQLLKNPVLVIRDLTKPGALTALSLERAYRSLISEAFSYRNLPNELRDIALNRSKTQVFNSGVRYTINNSSDNSERVTSSNRAIRFNVLDSMKKLINKMQDVMGAQFGANAVELSAHIYPAPDHAPAQGHQFSLEEVEKMQSGEDFKDLNGNSYVGFERNIGEWNCRHYFMKIKKGAEPRYTQKQLDKILEDNERGYTDETGRHYTLYECTQIQRRYEREIRGAKEKYLYGKFLNDKNMMAAARNRVGVLTTRYKQFSRQCDVPIKLERIRVKDYK